jgi:phage repressor protein C with HTH and peptisase S24 domain
LYISKLAPGCNPVGMDIKSIRRTNVIKLLKGRSKAVCAELWGTSPSYLSQMLSDNPTRSLGDVMARRIEAAELLPHGWLDQVHDEGDNSALNNVVRLPIPRDNDLNLIGDISPWDSETPLESEEVEVPLYKEVEISAGGGATSVQPVPGRCIRLSRSTLRDAGVEPANAMAATVAGNSMSRLILDGSTVGIDRGTTNIIDGEIYAIEHGGMLRVKYLYRQPGGGLRLRSENSDEHPDEIYSAEEVAESIRIIGFVFWWSTIRPTRGRGRTL